MAIDGPMAFPRLEDSEKPQSADQSRPGSRRRFNLAEQFREALAAAWQRALQSLEEPRSFTERMKEKDDKDERLEAEAQEAREEEDEDSSDKDLSWTCARQESLSLSERAKRLQQRRYRKRLLRRTRGNQARDRTSRCWTNRMEADIEALARATDDALALIPSSKRRSCDDQRLERLRRKLDEAIDEAMGRIGLLFELRHAETRPGETVTVVGARGELGAWDCYRSGLQLRTGASCYPYWAMLAPVWVSPGIDGSSASLCRSQDMDTPGHSVASPRIVRDASVIPEEPEVVSCGEVEDARNSNFIQVEYKYVKDRRQVKDCGPSIQWEDRPSRGGSAEEDSIANRMVSLPFEPGSIWIISDSKFNDAREQPKVIRTSLVEILSRRDKLDMEFRESLQDWLIDQDAHSPEWSGREEDDESSHHSWGTNWSHHTTSTIGFLTGF
eukprot:g29561.t1